MDRTMIDRTSSEVELFEDGKPTGFEEERSDPDIDQIQRPFDPNKIKVARETKTVSLICTRIDHREVDLAPEFQRLARIWDQGRKGRLIESILLRIPLPVFYVASDYRDLWSVVDGLQRMTTIHDFMNDEFPLRGLEYLVKFNTKKYSELPRNMQRRIEETELVINIIQPGTPEEVMFNIFSRINTGGISLNSQEIRHALNSGPVRDFLKDLVSTVEFQSATTESVSDKRMAARECALRFLAFYLVDWREYKNNDLDGFLNATMKRINELKKNQRDGLKSIFQSSMTASRRVLGDDAFRKRYHKDAPRSPISKALFETWSVALAKRKREDINYLVARSGAIRQIFTKTLHEDRDFEVSISYSTGVPARVHKRFSTIENLIDGVLVNA